MNDMIFSFGNIDEQYLGIIPSGTTPIFSASFTRAASNLTQKVSNISKKPVEVAFCARILATMQPPVGIYFISEDMFTLASYYLDDLKDTDFLPSPDWTPLPDVPSEERKALSDV